MTLIAGAEPYSGGDGTVGVALIHGFTGSPKSMKPWAKYLQKKGLSVEVPRLPGHGTRWQDMNATKWEDWYAEADRSVRKLQERCDTVFVMGLSMGGSLCLRLAENRNDIAGVVVINPAVHTERPDRFALPALRWLVPAFPGISNDIKKPDTDEGAYDKIPLQAAYSMTRLWGAVKSDITKVDVPLLLFRSVEDHVVEPSNAAWIMANVASSDKEEVVLYDSYHVATIDNDAPQIYSKSLDFVKRVLKQQAASST